MWLLVGDHKRNKSYNLVATDLECSTLSVCGAGTAMMSDLKNIRVSDPPMALCWWNDAYIIPVMIGFSMHEVGS